MSEKSAKALRRAFYGDYSIRARKHDKLTNGQIIADTRRQMYQQAKRRMKK